MLLKTQSQAEWRPVYRLLTALVQPRPIAWVSTVSAQGQPNLAPFSFFNVVCANPPTIVFCPMQGDGVPKKDTLKNIEEHPEFVVQIVSRELAEVMNMTSADFAPDVNEFEVAGLTAEPAHTVSVPRVGEAKAYLECRLNKLVPVGEGGGSGCLVLGEVLCIEIEDSVMTGNRVDLEALAPIGRLSGSYYCSVEDRFSIDRPTAAGLGRPAR